MHHIEQLTLWDLNDLMAYWHDYPPTHVLVAAYLTNGNKKTSGKHRQNKTGVDKKANSSFGFDDLAREVAFAGGTITNKLPETYRLR
ncbi:MAG TPA: hypothetical protein VFB79_08095 [Candidatus Angelobacter sp.]|nr:hypothetical protein [Candidatus Angelobacter sp.]